MKQKGHLIILSGFSGAGKGSIVRKVCETDDSFVVSVSATTRKPRENERHGEHYFFVDEERFLEMIEKDELLEHAVYREKRYGTPAAYVREMMERGKNVILEIEVQGARQIKSLLPESILIFVTAPSIRELRERLTGRGTESKQEIDLRLLRAVREADYLEDYDYLLVNETLDDAVTRFIEIARAHDSAMANNTELANTLRTELAVMEKESKAL